MSQPSPGRRANDPLRAVIEELLAEAPPELRAGGALDPRYLQRALVDPAHDILRRPGKEFRRRMLELCYALAGGEPGEHPPRLPLVVELLHAGSLVIDDIEDDSHTRRGAPALHRTYGVPVALNTGNWLYFLPFTLLARMGLPESLELKMCADVADAVVLCHQGQALDLSARVTSVRQTDMAALVAHATQLKTGSLMRLAAVLGARAARASDARIAALARFGAELGLGLQMLDDWSGIMVDARRHKGIEDLRLRRPTWPWAWLAERYDEVRYASLVQEARRVTIDFEAQNLLLRVRAHLDGQTFEAIRAHLHQALAQLGAEVGESPALAELTAEVSRLEKAYG